MNIDYDLNENYFKCYNEAQGIILNRKKILKNPKRRITTYLGNAGLLFLEIMLIFFICFFVDRTGYLTKFAYALLYFSIFSTTIYLLSFYYSYFLEKKKNHSGTLKFSSEELTDECIDGTIVTMKWDKIKALVIKKHALTFVTESQIFFFVNVTLKKEVLNAIKKYNNKLLIIEK